MMPPYGGRGDDPSSPQESSGDTRLMILLAMAMFVLVVDTSLMNVSISAVVARPRHDGQRRAVGDRARGARLRRVHPDRQQGRRPDRAQARVRPRAARLRRRGAGDDARAGPDGRSSSSGRSSAGSAPRSCCPPCSRSSTATSRAPRSGRPTRWSAPRPRSPPRSGRCSAASSRRTCRGAWRSLLEVVIIAVVLLSIKLVRDAPVHGRPARRPGRRGALGGRHGRHRARHPRVAGGRRGRRARSWCSARSRMAAARVAGSCGASGRASRR